jgi:hypothetical protein
MRRLRQISRTRYCKSGTASAISIILSMRERLLYQSGNGDAWLLTRDPASKLPAVKQEPKLWRTELLHGYR